MTKNESKLLAIPKIAKASALCLLFSAFSVNAATATTVTTKSVDEIQAVQQGKRVTGDVLDNAGIPIIGANILVKGTTNGPVTDFDGNYTLDASFGRGGSRRLRYDA